MKKFLLILFSLFTFSSFAQPIHLHVGTGLANYNGDLRGNAFSLAGANIVVSAGATYDLSEHFSLRSEYSFAKFGADDKNNKNMSLVQRNLNFKTFIRELSLVGIVNLYDINDRNWTPYFFAGVGVFRFSPYTYGPAGNKVHLEALDTEGQGMAQFPDRKPYELTQMNIPFGFGAKYALSENVNVSFEMGYRKLFTDYLDDVSLTMVDYNDLLTARGPLAVKMAHRADELKLNPIPYPQAGAQRGSPKEKDAYYFFQAKVSMRMPWFSNGGSNYYNLSRKRYGCPSIRF